MKAYILNSLCKKCPYSTLEQCNYKQSFYKKIPVTDDDFKVIHKCVHYRSIYKKGQYVLVDLYHQVLNKYGKWEYVIATKNVPGIIKGTRGNKFIVELIEAHCLLRRKGRRHQSSHIRVFTECTRTAGSIRPLDLFGNGGGALHAQGAEQFANDLLLN